MFQAMTHDDAGTRVQLVRFNVTHLPWWPVGPLPKAVQREMKRVAMAGGNRNLRSVFLALMPSAVALGWLVLPLFIGTLMAQIPYRYLMPFLMLVVMPVMFRLAPWSLSDKKRQSCARVAALAGYCGSCGYPLPLPNLSTRLCRCSECGAAWAWARQAW